MLTIGLRDSFVLPEGAKVLDVGSGNRPHPQATVLCDLYDEDNSHRGQVGQTGDNYNCVHDGRPFVVGDVCSLPFPDDSFDFAICRHTLEHIEDVEKAISELERVAPMGYIEVPSMLHELLYPCPEHIWYFVGKDNNIEVNRHPQQYPFPNEYPMGMYHWYSIDFMKAACPGLFDFGFSWDRTENGALPC